MALLARRLRRALTTALAGLGVAIIAASLFLLLETTQNSLQFDRLQVLILLINAAGVVVLLILIVGNLVRLIGEYRRHAPGARLKVKMVAIFTVLAVAPLMIVYAFSIQFIRSGIDSWFDVEVSRGLEEALNVSRTVLDIRMREHLDRTEAMATQLARVRGVDLIRELSLLQRETGAIEVSVFGNNSRIVATSSARPAGFVPARPPDEVMLQVRLGRPFYGLEPLSGGRLYIRTVVALPVARLSDETLVLQALYPVAERLAQLTESVRAAYTQYRELAFLRQPLKASFVLTLTLVLLLSILAAVWGAFFAGRRLVAPIQNLVAGTRAVAKGDFDTRLPSPTRDDIGFLVNSFNDMTRRLAEARRDALLSQNAVESERANLEAILSRLSTGVLALEPDLRLRNANEAAGAILGGALSSAIGRALPELAASNALIEQFVMACRRHLDQGDTEWREQITLRGEVGRRVLNCACTALPGEGGQPAAYVLVFDDITALLQAQRDAAWGEVARRLAHEIKNPLTPIQLSAERLRRRYLHSMSEEEARILESSTRTIVHQVEAMKEMVDAFRDYARAPDMDLASLDLNRLIVEVAELYRTRGTGPRLELDLGLDLDPALPRIEADMGRIRQILHNLFTNAVEALQGNAEAALSVRTRAHRDDRGGFVEIEVADNGPGFRVDSFEELFEPYVTSKPKGTGLGLAIVKKIVEEHGGHIMADNSETGGARVIIVLPVDSASRAAITRRAARGTDVRRERA